MIILCIKYEKLGKLSNIMGDGLLLFFLFFSGTIEPDLLRPASLWVVWFGYLGFGLENVLGTQKFGLGLRFGLIFDKSVGVQYFFCKPRACGKRRMAKT